MKSIGIFLILISIQPIAAQQNLIYNGGSGYGHEVTYSFSNLNHSIFNGAADDGWDTDIFLNLENGAIHHGGVEDGFSTVHYEAIANNRIFSHGNDDGHSVAILYSTIGNSIFKGGSEDGGDYSRYDIPTNNGMFAGGQDDGFHTIKVEDAILDCMNDRYLAGEIPMGTYQAANTIISSGQISNGDVHLSAGGSLEFHANFEIHTEGQLTAVIGGCAKN